MKVASNIRDCPCGREYHRIRTHHPVRLRDDSASHRKDTGDNPHRHLDTLHSRHYHAYPFLLQRKVELLLSLGGCSSLLYSSTAVLPALAPPFAALLAPPAVASLQDGLLPEPRVQPSSFAALLAPPAFVPPLAVSPTFASLHGLLPEPRVQPS